MNMDQARSGDGMKGILSPPKPKAEKKNPDDISDVAGVTEPVFSGQEQKLNIEVPQGWKVAGN